MNDGPVRVLVARPVSEDDLRAFGAVAPRLEVRHVPWLYPPTWDPVDPGWSGDPPWTTEAWETWRTELARAEVLFDLQWVPDLSGLRAAAPMVRWIQSSIAGVAGLVRRMGTPDGFTLTTASGVHAVPLAEWVVLSSLLLIRGPLTRLAPGAWEARPAQELRGRTALVIGLGHVGRGIAGHLRALGVDVWGVRRRDGASDVVDRLVPMSGVRDVLGEVDLLVLATPETPETIGLIDRDALSRLPARALVINVGRGSILDEDALIAALAAGSLAGAALDVFSKEPLPASSPLWTMPNVIVSPHAAGVSVKEDERILALFLDNLARYLAGRPLLNAYDPDRGY